MTQAAVSELDENVAVLRPARAVCHGSRGGDGAQVGLDVSDRGRAAGGRGGQSLVLPQPAPTCPTPAARVPKGPVVLAVVTDRESRWWQGMGCCSRCAAATPGAKTSATSQAPTAPDHPCPTTTASPAPSPAGGAGAGAPQFSNHEAVTGSVPAPRTTPARRHPPQAKIAQRVVPPRSAARRPAGRTHRTRRSLPGLPNRATSPTWRCSPTSRSARPAPSPPGPMSPARGPAMGGPACRAGRCRRPPPAPAAHRRHHRWRPAGCGSVVDRQWEHTRSVLAYVFDHTPLPGPGARLPVLMLTLRTPVPTTSSGRTSPRWA